MPLDGVTAKCLANELQSKLADARLDKIHQPDRYDIIMQFRQCNENLRLILSANPAAPRIHLTAETRENPAEPPMFCMLLRKHLAGARLISISTPEYERIFQLKFTTLNEMGDRLEKTLVIEIMGRHSNIILLNQDGRIHDAILHIDDSISRVREVMPARPYVLPPSQGKLGPQAVLTALQAGQAWISPAAAVKSLEKAILESVQGFSPQLCTEVVCQADLDARLKVNQLDAGQIRSLNQAMNRLCQLIIEGHYAPSTFYDDENALIPIDFHALPLLSMAIRRESGSVSQAMDLFYLERSRQNILRQKKQSLEKILSNHLEHARKKLLIHETDQAEGENRDQYRLYGEIILANAHRIAAGQSEVEAINYYQEDQPEIHIPLQANLTPAQNAQRYFKLYAKARSRYESGMRFALDDKRDIEYLESLQNALAAASEPEDLIALRQEISSGLWLRDSQYRQAGLDRPADSGAIRADDIQNKLHPGKPGSKSRRQQKAFRSVPPNNTGASRQSGNKRKGPAGPAALPPRRYVSSDGLTILVGRNNLQNDQLTLKTAQKDDIWLHVQKMPGTHVIIRTEKQAVPERTLLEAAEIAAWFSRAATALPENITGGHSGSASTLKIAVDYCPAANVRKPPGARPGMVIYDHYQTLLVSPKDPQDLA